MYEKGKILGGIELLAALLAYGVWTMPFRHFGLLGSDHPLVIATGLLAVLFLVLPLIGLWGMFKKKRSGYLALAAFPIVAFTFGVTAVPFVKHFYGAPSQANTVIIAVINILVVVAALWLFARQSQNGSNK